MAPAKQITITINADGSYLPDLEERLKKYGISHRELAREAGYEDTDLSRMFNKNVTPRLDKIARLETAILEIRKRRAKGK